MGKTSTYYLHWIDQININFSDRVGKKSANLGELHGAGFQVPKGFALGLDIYEGFMKRTGALEEINHYLTNVQARGINGSDFERHEEESRFLRGIVESKKWPADMEHLILQYYEDLCKFTGKESVPVAVRSAGPLSRPGQYETYLYARGRKEILQKIIKVFSSTFNIQSLLIREQAGLPRNYDPIGVAVTQMVNAKAAGVIFTLNPINGDRSKIIIEGNWGLGESVVGGHVIPDEWEIDKVLLEIIRRKISHKQIEYIVDHHSQEVILSGIPPEKQAAPCLTDPEILELARLAKAIEKHFGRPQDIEWAIDKDLSFPDNIFFVQTRPETAWNAKLLEPKLKTTGSPSLDVINFYRNLKA